MPRFFEPKITGENIILSVENSNHITKSLRMRPGEILTLSDANGIDCEAEILSIGERVHARILELRQNTSEPSVEVTLYQALPKVGKFETIVQKSVELGVSRIVPMLTSRCVSRPDEKAKQRKIERYQKISAEAAKQSGRGKIPEVCPLMEYTEVLEQMENYDICLFFYEEGGEEIGSLLPETVKTAAIIIGSEGGFSQEEVKAAQERGARVATLGPRILRCETAPITALSVLMYLTKNL